MGSVYDKDRLFPKGKYTFIITLDNNAAQTFQKELDTWKEPTIMIGNNGKISVETAVV